MDLWLRWMSVVRAFRPACSRARTFLWLSLCLAGMCIRPDLAGVTSIEQAKSCLNTMETVRQMVGKVMRTAAQENTPGKVA